MRGSAWSEGIFNAFVVADRNTRQERKPIIERLCLPGRFLGQNQAVKYLAQAGRMRKQGVTAGSVNSLLQYFQKLVIFMAHPFKTY